MKRYADQPFNAEDMYRIPIDPSTQQPVVYQLPKQQDKRKKSGLGGKPYSVWAASKYILMISLMLYWLPLVGQMIGGFIGGRRAGSPFRAIIAAIVPVAIFFGISMALQTGFIPIKLQNATVLAYTLVEQTLERLPIASPYVSFATTYVGSFINELKSAASLKVGNYLITIAFAYVGGILSDQSRRELEYVSRYGSPTTNILVSGREQEQKHVQFPNPLSFFHSLVPSRRTQQASGFASLMPVAYSANGTAPARRQQVSRAQLAQDEQDFAPDPNEGRMVRRRPVAPEFKARSWEDVYLRNMRIAGLSGAGVGRHGSKWNVRDNSQNIVAAGFDQNAQEQPRFVRERVPARQVPAVVRKDRIRDESTRKLVERALGKDYVKGPSASNRRASAKLTPLPDHASGQKSAPAFRKNGEWELL